MSDVIHADSAKGAYEPWKRLSLTRSEAFELLKEYNSNPGLIRHALAVESIMLHFAGIPGEAEREK